MPEPFALTCGCCGELLLPNLSQADADGCLWICINPDCPELCAGELETEDLVEGGVPQALAARLVRLIDYYEDTIEELRGEEGGGAAAPPPPPIPPPIPPPPIDPKSLKSIPPPIPPPAGASGFGSGLSTTMASAVTKVEAIDTAFSKASRVTLTGSTIPAFIKSFLPFSQFISS